MQRRVFEVEMQAEEADDLAKRMRYYQPQVDMLTMVKGFDYEELPVYTFRSL